MSTYIAELPDCPTPPHLVPGADLATKLVQGVAAAYARQPSGAGSYLGAEAIERNIAAFVRRAAEPENIQGFSAALRMLVWSSVSGVTIDPATWDGAGALAFERGFLEFESVDRTLQAITSGTLEVGCASS